MVPVSKINLTGVGFMDDRGFALVHRRQEYLKDTVQYYFHGSELQLLNQYPANLLQFIFGTLLK